MRTVLVALVPYLAVGHPSAPRPGVAYPSPIRSYHVHVQYLETGSNSTAQAMRLRDAYMAKFGNATCDGLFDQEDLCMYAVETHHGGIFLSGNWASYVTLERYQEVVAWTVQHRGELSVLFHPNSDNYVHDHFRWSTWVGRPWPLNVEAFSQYGDIPGEHCNEFECYYGNSGGWGGI